MDNVLLYSKLAALPDSIKKEVADFIQVDSLAYLSLEGMLSVMKENNYCTACFSGKYPVEIPKTQSKYLLETSHQSHGT